MVVRVTEVVVMVVRPADQVIDAECDEYAAGNVRKNVADPRVHRDTEPGNRGAKHDREQHVSRSRERGNRERLVARPTLPASGQHERQPVRRQRGMEKRHRETGRSDASKQRVVHVR